MMTEDERLLAFSKLGCKGSSGNSQWLLNSAKIVLVLREH